MSDTPTSTAIAKQDNGPGALITKYRADFAMVLPEHIKPDHWVRLSQGLLRRDKNLARVAQSNPGSFLAALLDCARLGLEPGDTYHLVPFGNEIQGIPDWTGLVELIYRAGEVSAVKAEVVYSNDDFRYEPGTMDRPDHRPDWFGDRGVIVGAYAYAILRSGATSQVVIYSKAQIDEVMKVSKGSSSPSSPWRKWYDRMALKTVVRRLSKLVPSSAEYRQNLLRSEASIVAISPELETALPEPTQRPHGDDVLDAEAFEDDDIVDAELVDDDEAGEPASAAPAPAASSDAQPIAEGQTKALTALLRAKGVVGPDRFDLLSSMLGRDVSAMKDISWDEAATLIDTLQGEATADDAA